jgi:hypothetical protein
MLRILRLTFLTLIASVVIGNQSATAQLFYSGAEYGISIGGSQYFGDLNDKYGFKFIRPAGGVFLRHHLSPYISVRGSFTHTQIGYEDKLNDNDYYRARNLSFKSNIVELCVQSEFNFTRFETGDPDHRFTPYLTGGVGVFYYSPFTEFGGQRHYLRPLGTEGQNHAEHEDRKYKSVAVCFPVGAGFKYWLKPGINLGVEVADRLTLTDYLDDVSTSYVGADKFYNEPTHPNPAYYLQDRSTEVSGVALGREGKQRGNSETRDQYMYFLINLSFQLKVYRCPAYLKEGTMEYD